MSMADGQRNGEDWWRDGVGYEVYIRSFADGNGDGVGDLAGLHQRLAHLAWLGVDVVWITPFYPSPMADFGYDVSDYCDVDPMFGTLVDFDAVVDEARRHGLRLMVDVVPNHTSHRHPWFVDALQGRHAAHRSWYVWSDPAPGGGPPNNWISHFGGPAWTLDATSGQYYMHLFLPEQPDLNWAEPAVADSFDDILRFWLDRGVDGFRIDVAHALVHDASLRDNPTLAPVEPGMTPRQAFVCFEHRYDLDQPGVTELFHRWRGVADAYGAVLLGEVYLQQADKVARYVEPGGLHSAFYFAPMHMRWDPAAVRRVLVDGAARGGGRFAWVQSSHDERRPVTRFGGGSEGKERAFAMSTLYLGLPGMMFLYQGEELGLADGVVPHDRLADPAGTRSTNPAGSRDGCRTPLPWEPVDGWGFTEPGVEPWLPFGDRTAQDCVSVQQADPGSWLHRYRRMVAARHSLPRIDAPVQWLDNADPVLGYRRGPIMVLANLGDDTIDVPEPPGSWTLRFATDPACTIGRLPPRSAWVAVSAAG
jgi:alpha-glucosidase